MSILDKKPDDEMEIEITPAEDHSGDSEQAIDFKKSRSPYMDLITPFRLGDDSTGDTVADLSNTEKLKIVQSLIQSSEQLAQGGPFDFAKKAVDDVKEKVKDKFVTKPLQEKKREAERQADKTSPQETAPLKDTAAAISNKIKKLEKDHQDFTAKYNEFFKIGIKVLDLIGREAHVMYYGDVERLNALSRFIASLRANLANIGKQATEGDSSGYELAKQLENPNRTVSSTVVVALPWDNPSEKFEKSKQEKKEETPKHREASYQESIMSPTRTPEEYKTAIMTARRLKNAMEGLKKEYEVFQQQYSAFIHKIGNVSSKLTKEKLDTYRGDTQLLQRLSDAVSAIDDSMGKVKTDIFAKPQTSALALTKNLLDKDRWKYQNLFERAEPSQEQAKPPASPAEPKKAPEQPKPAEPSKAKSPNEGKPATPPPMPVEDKTAPKSAPKAGPGPSQEEYEALKKERDELKRKLEEKSAKKAPPKPAKKPEEAQPVVKSITPNPPPQQEMKLK